jgi:hypothetical protein
MYGADLVWQRVTIGSLPDDVLLEIFYIYLVTTNREDGSKNWPKLVHVCRRWRCIIFASPVHLNLELLCTSKTPVRRLLDIWPEFPLVIDFYDGGWLKWNPEDRLDNLIAALEHRERVRRIHIDELTSSELERITTVMEEPFPALTSLFLYSINGALPVPNTFLNGSAPSLQRLYLLEISFPSLPRLLLSASHLTSLQLYGIPNTGYISPESMATCLSALTMLGILDISFRSPTPDPKRRSRPRPPLTRAVLPALTKLEFRGVSEYLEVLAARIDAPQLDNIRITFCNQLVFDIPQIARFIGHQELSRPSELSLSFCQNRSAYISFSRPQDSGSSHGEGYLLWRISCKGLDWQVFAIAQLCAQILPLCSIVDGLNIEYGFPWEEDPPLGIQPDDMDPTRWLELFHSFTSVQRLKIPAKLEPFIAAALQGLTEESAAEVLPTLHNLSIEGPTTDRAAQQAIESFVAARQHSHHPLVVDRR